jgi:N-acetylmuramoyl-L-alanine amidase
MNIKNKISLIGLVIFLAGCATTPKGPSVLPVFQDQITSINGINYVPLIVVCDKFDLRWSWDTVARKAGIQNKDLYVRFMEGSDFVLVKDKVQCMEGPAVLHQGALMVPVSFVQANIVPSQYKSQEVYLPRPKAAVRSQYLLGKVVIDPGHGGHDPGAIGRLGLKEKEVTLDIAKDLKKRLEVEGFVVYLTRSDDRFIQLARRPQIANNYNADFFISIHANAAKMKNAKGFEVFYLAEAADDSAKQLAEQENACLKFEQASFNVVSSGDLEATLWDLVSTENRAESIQLANQICKEAKKNLWVRQRGVKSAKFYVLKGARMPAVLVEVGFVTNRDEEAKLETGAYRSDVASAIANGILNYREEYQLAEGFTK